MLSSSPFRIIEHVVPGQHIREYPRATANEQEDILHLSVKQYIPLDNPNPQHGDVTIIAAHANGFPKVCYNVAVSCSLTMYIRGLSDNQGRNSMSLFGKKYMRVPSAMDFAFAVYGWQM